MNLRAKIDELIVFDREFAAMLAIATRYADNLNNGPSDCEYCCEQDCIIVPAKRSSLVSADDPDSGEDY